jgi:hypothetical protein
MKAIVVVLCIISYSVFAQQKKPTTDSLYIPEYFIYNIRGLQPSEIRYSVASKTTLEIYNVLVNGFESKKLTFPDEHHKILKKSPGSSFVIKGTRKYVYCGDNFIGGFCLDAKYEILVKCEDEAYILKPLKLKRGLNSTNTVWGKIPLKGPANFYKKNGRIKKECSNCEDATEDVLKRISMATLVFTRNIKIEMTN